MCRGVLALVVVAACGGRSKPAAQEPTPAPTSARETQALSNTQPASAQSQNEAVIAKMEEFAAQMCACKASDCAKKVSSDVTVWSQQMAQQQSEPVTMSEEEMSRATELGSRMSECMMTALGTSSLSNP